MKRNYFSKYAWLFVASVLFGNMTIAAASYDDYDDDIYYNTSKAKQKAAEEAKKQAEAEAQYYREKASSNYVPNTVVEYSDPSHAVITGTGLNVDVDTYNRRGQFLVADSVAPSTSDDTDTYAYTRRIEKYYNGDIVNGSNNQELIDSYYSTPATTSDVNIYVVNANPWGLYNSWYNPWNAWTWNSLYWNSWYYPSAWSWGWYDPWYSWGWSTPGWGWNWSWNWGWNRPGWGPPPPPRPGNPGPPPGGNGGWAVNSPGLSRPHGTAGSNGSSSTATRRPGAFSAGANTAMTRPATTVRPAAGSSHNTGSDFTNSINRGRYNGGSTTITTTPSVSGTTRPSVQSTPSRSTTTTRSTISTPKSSSSSSFSGSSNSSSGRSSSFGSGRSSGGFSGGSSSGGGAGSTRGRR